MVSILRMTVLAFVALTAASGQSGQRDALFSQLPFDQWREGAKAIPIHWSADLVAPELSAFQRIAAGVRIQVDNPELPKHHALILAEFEDADGGVWQTHGVTRVRARVRSERVRPARRLLRSPSRSYDPVTQEHGFAQKKLHVAPLKADPLPGVLGRAAARGVSAARYEFQRLAGCLVSPLNLEPASPSRPNAAPGSHRSAPEHHTQRERFRFARRITA